jgi:hypothetical protein
MAANPERGEVDLVAGGRTYTLKLSMNAAVTLEQKYNKTAGQIMAEASQLNFQAIRAVMWLLLQKYHSSDFPTEEAVGTLVDELGSVSKFWLALEQLAKVNNDTGAKTPAGPRKARSGTGANSSSSSAVTG